MNKPPGATRYEIKMETDQSALPTAHGWVRLHSAGFSQAYPPRQVNNIYFDTLGMDTLSDHIEGVSERRKLRLRWYGREMATARGQLELKEKSERVGRKQVYPLDVALDLGKHDWADIQSTIVNGLNGETSGRLFRELLLVSRPLVINSYWREYFISANQQVRLTLDYDLRAYDQWLTPHPNLTFRAPLVDQVVIEFKSEIAHARYLADVLAEFPLRANRHSKFVTALGSFLER